MAFDFVTINFTDNQLRARLSRAMISRITISVVMMLLFQTSTAASAQDCGPELVAEIHDSQTITAEQGSNICIGAFRIAEAERRAELIDWLNSENYTFVDPDVLEQLSASGSAELRRKTKAYALAHRQGMTFDVEPDELEIQIAEALEENDPTSAAILIIAAQMWTLRHRDNDLLMEYNERLRGLLEENSFPVLAMKNDLFRGIYHDRLYEYDLALEKYMSALVTAEKLGDVPMQMSANDNLGNVFYYLGDNNKAALRWDTSIKLLEGRKNPDPRRLMGAYNRQALVTREQEKPQIALDWTDKALALATDEEHMSASALSYVYRAEALDDLGQKSEAIKVARTAIQLTQKYRSESEAAVVLAWTGMRELELGNTNAASRDLAAAKAIFQPNGESIQSLIDSNMGRDELQDYSRIMGEVLNAMGRPDEAFEYTRASLMVLQDQLENDKMKAVGNAELLFSLRDRENQIALERQDRELAEVREQRANLGIAFAVAIALATLIAAYAFRRGYLAQRSLAASKDMFLSELNHRVGNNLQTLTSLFRISDRNSGEVEQSGGGANVKALSRVQAMSVLHGQLSSQPDGRTLNARDYLTRLTDTFSETLPPGTLKVTKKLEESQMDVDTLTPLGLLISEILTNTVKHGSKAEGGRVTPSELEVLVTLSTDNAASATLRIRDNGLGFEQEHTNRNGLGIGLIDDLASQFGGNAVLETAPGSGVSWEISGIPTVAVTDLVES